MLPWYFLPQIGFSRFKAIDFFPPRPQRLDRLKSICIGTKNRTIGDALVLSSLPRKLKHRYPDLKILTYPRGFNPVVFWNNPYVDGMTYFPDSLFGDDCNWGSGHNIRLKENFFEIADQRPPKPELYLTETETRWSQRFLGENSPDNRLGLPLLTIHPFGQTRSKVLTLKIWGLFVAQWRNHFRIAQLGVEGQPLIPGCDIHFLAPRRLASGRKLFALVRQAQHFIGVDSGPMHIARAFGIPSLVITNSAPPEDVFRQRMNGPYFLYGNHTHAFLYEDQEHLYVTPLGSKELIEAMSSYISRAAKNAVHQRGHV